MADGTVRGRFVWHELMTTDTAAAAAFYTNVVGWKTQPFEQDPSYTIWMAPGGPAGGLMTLPADARAMGAPPSWLIYVGTPDVGETVADAQRLGARVLKDATEIPSVGRFAVLADPQGAVFAAFTPAPAPMGGGGAPKTGEFSWHELATTDHEAAFRFYQQLFGWEVTGRHDMGAMGTYQLFGLEGTSFGGMYSRTREPPAPPQWLSYASVGDAGEAARLATAAGGKVLMGPTEVPGGSLITQCFDPQGALFAVMSAKEAAPVVKPAPKRPAPKAAKKVKANKVKAKKPKARRAKAATGTARKAAAKKAKAPRRSARAKGGKKRR